MCTHLPRYIYSSMYHTKQYKVMPENHAKYLLGRGWTKGRKIERSKGEPEMLYIQRCYKLQQQLNS